MSKKWSEPKGRKYLGKGYNHVTYRIVGFKTNKELQKFIKDKKLKHVLGWGYNKKDKHFLEYREAR